MRQTLDFPSRHRRPFKARCFKSAVPLFAYADRISRCLVVAFLLSMLQPLSQRALAQEAAASNEESLLSTIELNTNSSSSSPSSSQNGRLDHAFQMWTPVYIDVPISKNKKTRGYFEANPRMGDNLNGVDQLLLRSALGYRFTPKLSGYLGHVWVGNFQPEFLKENRVFQQLGFGHVIRKRLQVLHRARLEERFIQNTDGECSMRARYMLRFALPLKERFYAVVSDELFVNLNTVPNGPLRGIDQNRIYAGIGRQMNNKMRLEVGYQQQYVNRSDPTDDRANHILVTSLFLSL